MKKNVLLPLVLGIYAFNLPSSENPEVLKSAATESMTNPMSMQP